MSNRFFSRRNEPATSRIQTAALFAAASVPWVGQSLNLVRRALPAKGSDARPTGMTLES